MQYKIFKHPSGSIESVKQGFSWAGFGFIFIWAFAKKLWMLGVSLGVLFVCQLILHFAERTGGQAIFTFVSNILILGVYILVGLKGNSWREKNLVSRGFEHVETVTAANSDGAMALYVAGSNMQSAAPAAQPSVSNRLQSAGHVG